MSTAINTVADQLKNFYRITKARMTGDENDVIIAKNYKKATRALESAISSKQGDLDDAEDTLENLIERLVEVTHPTREIKDRDAYINSMVEANNAIILQRKVVKTMSETVTFLKSQRLGFEVTEKDLSDGNAVASSLGDPE